MSKEYNDRWNRPLINPPAVGPKFPVMGWAETGESCPKCGGRMIINTIREECSEMECDHIKRTS